MAISVVFTPPQGSKGGTPGTVSAALSGLSNNGTYNFSVDGPGGTWVSNNVTITGTTYTLVFPVHGAGPHTVYTQLMNPARAAVPSGVFQGACD